MKLINGTWFKLDFCKKFNAEKLRLIYNGESAETLDLLIEEIYPKEVAKPKAVKK